jgi:LCP family protein required for cell wall assembly
MTPTPAQPPARPRLRRTRRQRVLLVVGTSLTVLCLGGAAAAFYTESWFAGIDRVTIVHATTTVDPQVAIPAADTVDTTVPPPPTKAMNVLLTGSDGRSCIDPASPYAGAFLGNGTDIGQRSDTIIVMHLDPATKRLGLLSFPRDLWVPIAGGARKDRINSAFKADDPNPLIQTIESTFGIRIDHYVGVDFCAFKGLVDAVGGISIPFEYPTRDRHTGLEVLDPGCHQMAGDEALAYVRSRYYEYQVNGRWVSDGTSDYGRIARQQDFIRRLATRALDKGATNPLTAKHLLDVAHSSNVRIDDGLSLSDLLGLGRAIRDVGPQSASSYRVEGRGQVIGGASVIVPDLTTPDAKAILAFFRGAELPAGAVPATGAAPGGTAVAADTAATPGTAAPATAPSGSTTAPAGSDAAPAGVATTSTVPTNVDGVFPPADVSCR